MSDETSAVPENSTEEHGLEATSIEKRSYPRLVEDGADAKGRSSTAGGSPPSRGSAPRIGAALSLMSWSDTVEEPSATGAASTTGE